MTLLLEFKEKLKRIYGKHSGYINPILKFILAMVVFTSINSAIGFLPFFTNIFVVLVLALICCIMPNQILVVVAGIMIIGHSYALGIEAAGIAIVLILLMEILCLRFVSKDCLAMLFMPLALRFGITALIPIGYGLKRNPSSVLTIGCGTITYYFIETLKEKAPVLQGSTADDITSRLKLIMDGIFKNQTMMIQLMAVIIVVLVVYGLRKLDIDFAWHIAIVLGSVVYIAVMMAGGLVLDASISLIPLIAGTIGSCILAFVFQFLVFNVDYSRAERLEYEDDEYYYYVKAIPKISITAAQREIKTFSDEPDSIYEEPTVEVRHEEIPEESNLEEPNPVSVEDLDLERKLEESLKNL
ncbi:MAG: hypothetical protein PHS82_03635 [Lachnospiraceae bacterium]|nr:hypothetical protein [Lachnospiraceae bacterium]